MKKYQPTWAFLFKAVHVHVYDLTSELSFV